MELDVKFSEQSYEFDVQCSESLELSDGGFDTGYEQGYSKGYSDGYASGSADGYSRGEIAGKAEGYETGYVDGDRAGHSRGYSDGYAAGYSVGYEEGRSAGHEAGYNEGYSAAEELLKNVLEGNTTTLVSDAEVMRDYCFYRGTLVEIYFPKCKKVGANAVYLNYGLLKGYFPMLEEIGSGAFGGPRSLTKWDFPKVKSIGASAFDGSRMLDTLILRNTEQVATLANVNALNNTPIAGGTGYIYVPRTMSDGSDGVVAYRAAINWSTYANQIRAIEDYPEITEE